MNASPSPSSLGLSILLAMTSLASGAVVQTNYGTGDGSLPGGSPIVAADNLLSTRLASATRTGEGVANPGNQYFYRENDGVGYNVDLARLYDGQFGTPGGVSSASVLPNQVSLTFNFDLLASPAGYNLTSIKTYAGWDSGRDGQQYTVQYSTAADPLVFLSLASVSRFDNTDFPIVEGYVWDPQLEDMVPGMVEDDSEASTLVQLYSDAGFLAENVAAVRFNFTGVENGGTGFREFVIEGAEVAAVPEPAAMFGTLGLLAGGLVLRRRNPRRC